jgi:hypothetical protein
MELQYENGAHRDNFLRVADRSDNIRQGRPKAGEFGSYQGSRLLQPLSAALPALWTRTPVL